MQSSAVIAISAIVFVLIGYIGRLYFPYPPSTIVGIDLGTSFSSVAIFNIGVGTITVIKDKFNSSLVPSIVNFYENGTVSVGHPPSMGSEKYVSFYDSKRFIGRNASSLIVLQSKYPFTIANINNIVNYVLPENFKNLKFTNKYIKPEQISSLILIRIKAIIKDYLGFVPKNVVMGVPVEFDAKQRELTIEAARMAGFNVLRLLNEPTAASMACGVHTRPEVKYVIVIDLGGGTYDVSLLHSQDGMLNTLSIAGDDRLGGRDFTDNFVEAVHIKMNKSTLTPNEFRQFQRMIEEAKIILSDRNTTKISFDSTKERWEFVITREEFEKANEKEFKRLLIPIHLVLSESNLKPTDIDEIVLVGGATKMPKVHNILTDFFMRKPNNQVDPDLAVVTGLANQAGILSEAWPLEVSAIDVTPKRIKKLISQ